MDRGAARSRKRLVKSDMEAAKRATVAAEGAASNQRLARLLSSPRSAASSGTPRSDRERRKGRPETTKKENFASKAELTPKQDRGPDQYKAKAIRTAHALVYSQDPFTFPPPTARLEGVTRVDLEGSKCTDVSWLPPSVTWLNLKGCPVTSGWEHVGGLQSLSVLNISECDLDALPKELAALKNLKALVAISNNWKEMDPNVVAGWKELNSLIVSHSPNLTSLPSTLAELPHLAKLTFSHCPRLTASALPDLSSLPLLRDVRANNLPRLDSLPPHITKWGTGDLALAGKASSSTTKLGDGLEVLDLGNCSLSYSSVSTAFGLAQAPNATKKAARWPHLRSLTLQANPLAVEQPSYVEQLQASWDLPKLQIIDARRVKERAKAGVVSESKGERKIRERREAKMRPTGANEHSGGKPMRNWGDAQATIAESDSKTPRQGRYKEGDVPSEQRDTRDTIISGSHRHGKRQHLEVDGAAERDVRKKRKGQQQETPSTKGSRTSSKKEHEPSLEGDSADEGRKKRERKRRRADKGVADTAQATERPSKRVIAVKTPREPKPEPPAPVASHVAVADPATLRAKKPSRSETAVVGVIDVKDGSAKSGGVDLKAALGSGTGLPTNKDAGSGLGLGGW